jgi:hypothetical protein
MKIFATFFRLFIFAGALVVFLGTWGPNARNANASCVLPGSFCTATSQCCQGTCENQVCCLGTGVYGCSGSWQCCNNMVCENFFCQPVLPPGPVK